MDVEREIELLYRRYEDIRAQPGCRGCDSLRRSLITAAGALHALGTRRALSVEAELRVWLAQSLAEPADCKDPLACLSPDPARRFVHALKMAGATGLNDPGRRSPL